MNNKNLGIWLNHSTANLFEDNGSITSNTIESDFAHNNKVDTMPSSINLMHNKGKQLHDSYYMKIANEILKYDHVLLFGPTNTRSELYNFLSEDPHFKNIKIDVQAVDKMTENEQTVFVRNHFENQ